MPRSSDPATLRPPTRVLAPARPRAARRRHRPARAGVRAGRGGHRQDPGDHPPHRLRRPRRGHEPAARPGGDVHRARRGGDARPAARSSGVGGVQARTFHARGPAPARAYFWPRVVGGELPRLVASKAGCSPRRPAAAAFRLAGAGGARPRRRGRVGQGDPDRRPTTTPPPPRRRAARRRRDLAPRRWHGSTRRTRRSSAAAGRSTSRTSCCSRSPSLEDRRRRRRAGARAVPPPRRRRVPGRQPAAAGAARPVAGRPRRRVRGRRRRADHLLLHRRQPDYLLGFPPRYPAAQVVRLVRDYRSTPQVVALANRRAASRRPARSSAARRRARRAAAGRARRRRSPATPTSPPRRPGSRPGSARCSTPGRRPARSPSSTGSTPSRRCSRRRWPRRASRTCCAAPSGSSSAPRCGRPSVLLRGAARAARRRPRDRDGRPRAAAARSPTRSAPCSPATGWIGRRRRPAVRRASAGSRWPRSSRLAEELAADAPRRPLADLVAELAERAAAQHAPTVEGVTLASLHAAKGLEWDAVFLVGLVDGHAADRRTPRPPRRSRRSAGCSTSGSPGPASTCHLSWAAARSPGGRGSRQPSRFLDGLRPAGERRPPRPGRPARRRARPRRAVGSAADGVRRLRPARWCRGRPHARALRRLPARRTTRSSTNGCVHGGSSGPSADACRRTSCSPTRRSRRSPRGGRRRSPSSRPSTASAR